MKARAGAGREKFRGTGNYLGKCEPSINGNSVRDTRTTRVRPLLSRKARRLLVSVTKEKWGAEKWLCSNQQ
jgi:hypothetical protein